MFNKLSASVAEVLVISFGFSACVSVYTGNTGFLMLELPALIVSFSLLMMIEND